MIWSNMGVTVQIMCTKTVSQQFVLPHSKSWPIMLAQHPANIHISPRVLLKSNNVQNRKSPDFTYFTAGLLRGLWCYCVLWISSHTVPGVFIKWVFFHAVSKFPFSQRKRWPRQKSYASGYLSLYNVLNRPLYQKTKMITLALSGIVPLQYQGRFLFNKLQSIWAAGNGHCCKPVKQHIRCPIQCLYSKQ